MRKNEGYIGPMRRIRTYESFLNESPDYVAIGTKVELGIGDDDAYTFGYIDGVLAVGGPGSTHANIRPEGGSYAYREEQEHAGRAWWRTRVLSFWEYPSEAEWPRVISDLESGLEEASGRKPNLMGEWSVEVVGRRGSQLVPVSKFVGSVPWDEESLRMEKGRRDRLDRLHRRTMRNESVGVTPEMGGRKSTMRMEGGNQVWKLPNGKVHRENGPSVIMADGTMQWHQNGNPHREDGPAIEHPNGLREWYRFGRRHRDDGPAIECPDGTKEWWKNGRPHREDGPAKEYGGPILGGVKEWWVNGKRHRNGGPAYEHPNKVPTWFRKGKEYTPTTEEVKAYLEREIKKDPLFVTTGCFKKTAPPELRVKYPEVGGDFGFFDATKRIRESVEYHKTLCSRFFDEDQNLDEGVREKLVQIAQDFYEGAGIGAPVRDIVLTGSIVGYHWTEHSDIDVHVMVDLSEACDEPTVARSAADGKAFMWNTRHEIEIRGHEVEVYIQDVSEEHISSGTYSLLEGEWIKRPNYDPPESDDEEVDRRYRKMSDWVRRVVDASKEARTPTEHRIVRERADRIRKKITRSRKDDLAAQGEFSVGNLVFKKLRRSGDIGRIIDVSNAAYDAEFSQR